MVDKKEIRCYNKVNYRTEGSDHMQQVMHLFFYTKKKFQMKINIIMNQKLLTYNQKTVTL